MKNALRCMLLVASVLTPGAAMAQAAEAALAENMRAANEIIVTARKREETLQSVPTTWLSRRPRRSSSLASTA